jgi:hypothetical protein
MTIQYERVQNQFGEDTIIRIADPVIRVLNIDETRRALGGLSRTYVFQLLREGELESGIFGNRRMVTVTSIDAYVARQITTTRLTPNAA